MNHGGQVATISKHLVLDPAYGRDAAQYYLSGALEAGRELVAYGADLLLRSFQTMERTLDNGMVLGVLFRQSIAALDAFMLTLENGAVGAAAVHSRGALEASFYIEFVLRRGKKEWAKRIWIYSLRQNLSWVRRGIPGRPETDQYLEGRKQMGLLPPEPTEEEVRGSLATEREILERLNADDLRELNSAFEALALKKGYEPDWFRPGKDGVSSVYKIACELDWLFEPKYDGFRGTVYISRRNCVIRSKRGNVFNRFSELGPEICEQLRAREVILDRGSTSGTVVSPGENHWVNAGKTLRRRIPVPLPIQRFW